MLPPPIVPSSKIYSASVRETSLLWLVPRAEPKAALRFWCTAPVKFIVVAEPGKVTLPLKAPLAVVNV